MRIAHASILLLPLVIAGCEKPAASPPPSDVEAETAAPHAGVDRPTQKGNSAAADAAAGQTIALTPDNTLIQFVGTHMGDKPDPRTGRFTAFSGTAVVDAGRLQSLAVDIDTPSLTTDIEKLTAHLKSPDFFDVNEYPQAKFVSRSIEITDGGTTQITGDLTLRGHTKSISFPAQVSIADGLNLDAGFEIDRTQFGMDYGPDKVHKEVAMTIRVDG